MPVVSRDCNFLAQSFFIAIAVSHAHVVDCLRFCSGLVTKVLDSVITLAWTASTSFPYPRRWFSIRRNSMRNERFSLMKMIEERNAH